MAQVLFFADFEVTKRDFDRLGIQLMLDSGIEVLVFDLSFISFPNLKRHQSFYFENYFEIRNFKMFREIFEKKVEAGAYGIVLMPLSFRLLRYWNKIWSSDLNLLTLRLGALPNIGFRSERSRFNILKSLGRPRAIARSLEVALLNKFTGRLGLQREASACLCAGRKTELRFSSAKKVLPTGSLDFNIYLTNPPSNEKKHIVFLDENEPFHPDFDRQGIKKINPENYFKDLSRFFDYLESRYNIPIIVAAHPTVDRGTYGKYLPGRKIIIGDTASLVRDSFGVVAHTSTAIQFAFLYEKPTCFFVTQEMTLGYRRALLKAYIDYGFHFTNVSNENELKGASIVLDESLAKKYVNDFVISEGTPKINTWMRLVDYIKEKGSSEDERT